MSSPDASGTAPTDAGTPPEMMPMQGPPPTDAGMPPEKMPMESPPPPTDAGTPPEMMPPPPDPPPMCGGVECRTSAEQGCCGRQCTDLTTNLNCGGCGNVCGLLGAGLACNCEKRNGAYGCYGIVGQVLALCKR